MTKEELKRHCLKQIECCEMWANIKGEEPHGKVYEEHKLILELLEVDCKKAGIEYYAIENTIDEYGHTRISKYDTYEKAKEDLKNKSNYFCDRGTGKIVKIRQWFEGFELKEVKHVEYERKY